MPQTSSTEPARLGQREAASVFMRGMLMTHSHKKDTIRPSNHWPSSWLRIALAGGGEVLEETGLIVGSFTQTFIGIPR